MSLMLRPVRIAATLGVIGGVTALCSLVLPANPTTVALAYVVVVLLLATGWGITEATIGSIVATVCLNLFFLPPIGTLTIVDPQNWVALAAFLVTAIVASQMSGRARQRNIDALARQRDLERLYALSRSLLLSADRPAIRAMIARYIADVFELQAVAIYDHHTNTVAYGGAIEDHSLETTLRDVARRAVPFRDSSGMLVIPIELGGAPIGALALLNPGVSDTVMQSIANLVAIGLERARAHEATARAEAARQSGELRATTLDALAHEFKTPLTSMRAATSDLLVNITDPHSRELVEIVDEELDRLQGLVSDAVQMVRVDARDFVLHRQRYNLSDVVAGVLRDFEPRLDGRRVLNGVSPSLSIDADRDLLRLALRQLLDNAVKYSPPTSTIEITAASQGGQVQITVHNSGAAIPEAESRRIFERFYRGAGADRIPGTGMGLTIVQQIAAAHGGTATVSSSAAQGTAVTLSLPSRGDS